MTKKHSTLTIGKLLQEIRTKHGYTQRGLAAALKLSPASVQKVEDDKTTFPFTYIRSIWPMIDNLDREVIRHALYRQVDHELES